MERFPLRTFLEPTTSCPFFCGTNESMVESLRGTGGSLRCKRRRLAAGSACHCDGFPFKLFSTVAMVPREHYAVPPLMDRAVHITVRKETHARALYVNLFMVLSTVCTTCLSIQMTVYVLLGK